LCDNLAATGLERLTGANAAEFMPILKPGPIAGAGLERDAQVQAITRGHSAWQGTACRPPRPWPA
jgi:hypothetical protein